MGYVYLVSILSLSAESTCECDWLEVADWPSGGDARDHAGAKAFLGAGAGFILVVIPLVIGITIAVKRRRRRRPATCVTPRKYPSGACTIGHGVSYRVQGDPALNGVCAAADDEHILTGTRSADPGL